MSGIPRPTSRGVPPKTGGIPRPSRTTVEATGSKTAQGTSKSSLKKCPGPAKTKKREPDWMPPLSTMKKVTEQETLAQKLKQKTIRRQAPEGEDLKMIKQIMKGIKDQEVTVHEFVGLVAPYTGDNGTILRTVLAAELSGFRILARKIYDNMTQDIGDVLTNEHIQLTESSKEKHATFADKMMRAIDEVYEYYPNFSFEKYYRHPEYMEQIFPGAVAVVLEEDQAQALMRQEAYHRMMWLRSEGDRLAAENKRLQQRLQELKYRQKDEMKRAAEIEKRNEEKREELEKTQEILQDQLDDMNTSIEKALVEQEIGMQDRDLAKVPPPPAKRTFPQPTKARTKLAENWNVQAAAEIEQATTSDAVIAETSRVSIASSKSSTGAIPKITKKRKEKKPKRPPPVPQERSPFHYSPPRTPPEARQQTSPFHYSPSKTPPGAQAQAEQAQAMETTRITTTTRTIERPSGLPRARRSLAPRDSWGGFR